MKKIVINICYGGFYLNEKFVSTLPNRLKNYGKFGDNSIEYRFDPELIRLLEEYGLNNACNERFCKLAIISIPDDIEVSIMNYDGFEEIHEKHRVFCPDGNIKIV